MEEMVQEALQRIPLFAGRSASEVERLGGLTNLVFRVRVGGADYLLRIAGEGTSDYIDRAVEAHNARVAAEAGVSAGVLFFNEADGLMLAEFIDDAVTMDAEGFRDTGACARAALAFRQLHRCRTDFRATFDVFWKMDEYLKLLAEMKAELPGGYEEVKQEAQAARKALRAHPARLTPCHCDPLAENFLDNGEHMWIVDWEYSGMNDPMWDLGDLSVEAEFGPAQDEAMMTAYFDGAPPAYKLGRMVLYKAMCDLLWTLWGVVQHANRNPADDFWAYATGRLERCRTLMADPDFHRHLEEAERGDS
jgi:thiamine kinase-like enzyme